jgi:putative ABC transport system substrate-binding protein
MKRRNVLFLVGGAALLWPPDLHAQQKMPEIGFLGGSASPGPFAPLLAAFHQGLSETGYVEGRNVAIEYRWAEGHYDRLPALAADLVARKVDLIATGNVASALAAKSAPRRSQSSLSAPATRSRTAWSPASPGRAAISPGSASSPAR